MKARPKTLAVIPARAGSKRLPRKNLLMLCGKPLIAWSIDEALKAQDIDRVIVSTDSEEIADTARAFGAEVPFLRPSSLATDAASTNDVVLHALSEVGVGRDDKCVILQPTSPLRTAANIDRAIGYLDQPGVVGIVSVCECEHSPLWSNTLPESGDMTHFLRPEVIGKRSQDLPMYYRLNGAIYAFQISELLHKGGIFYDRGVSAYRMEALESIDIDTLYDFRLAEIVMLDRRRDLENGWL